MGELKYATPKKKILSAAACITVFKRISGVLAWPPVVPQSTAPGVRQQHAQLTPRRIAVSQQVPPPTPLAAEGHPEALCHHTSTSSPPLRHHVRTLCRVSGAMCVLLLLGLRLKQGPWG